MNMGMDAVFLETAIFKAQSHQGRRYETRKTK
jgi:thiazole synthase ThiGH ThiG subunit